MKHVQIVAFCDGEIHEHGGQLATVPATVERTISVDGSKPVLLDMCAECDHQILAILTLMERGAAIDLPVKKNKGSKPPATATPAPSDLSTACPEEDCGYSAPNRAALGQHTRSQHGKGLKQYRESA